MSKYLVTAQDDEGQTITMTLEFDSSTFRALKSWVFSGNWPIQAYRKIWTCPPLVETEFLKWEIPGFRIEEMPEDLSFGRFWEEYGYKVGNKKKVEKQFNELPEADRIKIFRAIPRYHRHLTITGINQAMASTWLTQERWNNDYSSKAQNKR